MIFLRLNFFKIKYVCQPKTNLNNNYNLTRAFPLIYL
jgi:hypothetical protein